MSFILLYNLLSDGKANLSLIKWLYTHYTWMIKVVFPCVSTLSLFLREVLIEGVLTDHHHLFLVRVQVGLTELLHDVLTHGGLEGRGGRKEGEREREEGKKEKGGSEEGKKEKKKNFVLEQSYGHVV